MQPITRSSKTLFFEQKLIFMQMTQAAKYIVFLVIYFEVKQKRRALRAYFSQSYQLDTSD